MPKKVSPGKPRRGRAAQENKAPTVYDVAKLARVSIFTVSAIVNNKGQVSPALQRRVAAAIEKLQYRPNLLARGLAKRQTGTVGIVITDISNPFFPEVVRAAEDEAERQGYNILLGNSDNQEEKERKYLEVLLSKRVDGIVMNKAPGHRASEFQRMLAEAQVPLLLLMRTVPELQADAVLTDDRQGAYDAICHLARVGHRTIAYVGGPLHISNAEARMDGFQAALKDCGLHFDRKLAVNGNYRIDSGYKAGLQLLPYRPDAVLIANYLMAVGWMRAAQELRMRCPRDFGLISFDDHPWLDCFHPRLTTVDLPKYELGSAAIRLLLERIAAVKAGHAPEPVKLTLAPRLRVRESCGFVQRSRP